MGNLRFLIFPQGKCRLGLTIGQKPAQGMWEGCGLMWILCGLAN
jgi:hypothetical protein